MSSYSSNEVGPFWRLVQKMVAALSEAELSSDENCRLLLQGDLFVAEMIAVARRLATMPPRLVEARELLG